jgi:predicted small metal-binding protein
MKTLYCRDFGKDCDAVMSGTTEEELLTKAAEHSREKHGLTGEFTEKDRTRIRSMIREEEAA